MVNASNPRLMNRVVDAVAHLCEGKGSTARNVLDFLRQSSKASPRNLTMQVRRALKHAVNAGLLRHRSGRYKALFTLNPAPTKQAENQNNDEKSADVKNEFDIGQPSTRVISDGTEGNRVKYRKQRDDIRQKRTPSRQTKRRRRSGSRRRDQIGNVRKLKYKEHERRVRSSPQKISSNRLRGDIGNTAGSSNRQKRRATPKDRTYYRHLSDCSDDEERKSKARRKSVTRQEYKSDGTEILNRRSASRNRSPQRQKSQQLQLKHSFDDEENKLEFDASRNNEADHDIDKDHVLHNSRGGSVL